MKATTNEQDVQAFIATRPTLLRFQQLVPRARLYTLSRDAQVCVLPLDEELHDAMHAAYGTGDWLQEGPRLSTGDMAFAARVSVAGPLAYIELMESEGEGMQCAVVWDNGAQAAKPMTLRARDAESRPRSLWPVNIALKKLGVRPLPGRDEGQTVGIYDFASIEDIRNRAIDVT